ncbi:PREDICTED: ankyrin repeat-containing protein At2g01680-like [Erythranthe guttata]|uniref:ankyrin repeat-containing protein At2g01680-like n=1 Tax=Erythranthe guttata TaxID=4155 RepID=UPI00064E0FFD|nr:PREDICTED: ankyrin repeat-containing protein At2g01680-like [Erythranthe guttata]|eukprot:XP_012831463.1 PREDICTED: ankyrin repeat-containing protein At2g01680-like [Erythranthe guttata]
MDKRLIDAAKKGDVEKLRNLIEEDPFLLRSVSLSDEETPLHIACIAGHLDFVKELLTHRPGFAEELSKDGFTPLHVASSCGDVGIVKELLKVGGSRLCLLKGRETRVPLHCTVSKGRVKVITKLLSACLDSIAEVTARGETCFHLAVKNNRFEAFKTLCEYVVSFDKEDLLNKKDERGNTVLHLASSRKQYEFIDLLTDKSFGFKGELEVNSLNEKGLTPLDVLLSQGGDCEIEEILTLNGATRVQETNPFLEIPIENPQGERNTCRPKSESKKLQDYFKYDKTKESASKARNTLLVIAVLIATAAYQAVLSPPGGVWQDDFTPGTDAKNSTTAATAGKRHRAGQAVMGTQNQVSYGLFLLFNSIGFFMSLHMMDFLTQGLSMKFELRIALFALVATYDTCMVAITPSGYVSVFFIALSVVMPIVMPLLTMVVRDYRKGWRRCESSSSVAAVGI